MIGQLLGTAWIALSWLFLAAVVWTVRKSRARGRRKFRDEPLKRLRALHPDPHNRTDLL